LQKTLTMSKIIYFLTYLYFNFHRIALYLDTMEPRGDDVAIKIEAQSQIFQKNFHCICYLSMHLHVKHGHMATHWHNFIPSLLSYIWLS